MRTRAGSWLAFAVALGITVQLSAGSVLAYRFRGAGFPGARDVPAVTPAGSIRWRAEDFPLRFRLLRNDRLPDHGGLNPVLWRDIVTRAFAHWTRVPTSSVRLVLDDLELAAATPDYADSINTVGFSGRESFEEHRGAATLYYRTEGKRILECDIEISPFLYENWDPDDAELLRRNLESTVIHEVGHCLGLAHSAMNPLWQAWPGAPHAAAPGVHPDGVRIYHPHPTMSYGSSFGFVGVAPDDAIGVSLLYPEPGFLESRGSVAGRVVFDNGEPVPFVYVQTVGNFGSGDQFGQGAFTDSVGQFLLDGLPAGPVTLWIRPASNLRAHFFLRGVMEEAGALEIRDRIQWTRVETGRISLIPEITVSTRDEDP